VVYPLVNPHQPSEFKPSTNHAPAAHFEDRIKAITWFVGDRSLKSSHLADTIGQCSTSCAELTSFTIISELAISRGKDE